MLCAAAGMAGFQLLAESLHAACVAAAAAGRAVAVLALTAINDVPWSEISESAAHIMADAAEAASSAAKTGGALLLVGLTKAAAAGEEVSDSALAGAKEMAATGSVFVGIAARDIAATMGPIIAHLSDEACEALQKAIALAVHVGKEGAKALWAAAVPAVLQAINLGRAIAPYLIYALIPLALPAVAAYFLYKGAAWLAGKAYGELKKLPYEEMAEVAAHVAEGAAKASAEAAKQIAAGATVLADGTIVAARVAGGAIAGAAEDLAPVVVDAAEAAARATAEAAKQAGRVIGDGAEVIGGAVVDAAGDVGDFVEETAGNALSAGQDFWESGIVQDALGDAVDGAEDIFNTSRAELVSLFKTLSGISIAGCFAWLDHNQLAILLDYMQIVGLFISRMAGGAWAIVAPFFGSIYNFFAVDFGAIVKGLAGAVADNIELIAIITAAVTVVVIIVVSAVALVIFCVLARVNKVDQMEQIKKGHEAGPTWSEMAEKNKKGRFMVKYLQIVSGLLLGMIVPVGRMALSTVVCEGQVAQIYRAFSPAVYETCNTTHNFGGAEGYSCDCSKFEAHVVLAVLAVIAGFVYVIAVPMFLCCLIKNNVPHGTEERLTPERARADGHDVSEEIMAIAGKPHPITKFLGLFSRVNVCCDAAMCETEITFDEDGEGVFCERERRKLMRLLVDSPALCRLLLLLPVVLFDRHRYLKAVQEQAAGSNPYASLYVGFERRWAQWKIVTSLMKFIIIVPTILLWKTPIAQVAVMCAITFVIAALNTLVGPFVSTISDEMQTSANWSAFATLLLGFIPVIVALIANEDGMDGGEQAEATRVISVICGVGLNIVQVVHLGFSLSGIAWGESCTRTPTPTV